MREFDRLHLKNLIVACAVIVMILVLVAFLSGPNNEAEGNFIKSPIVQLSNESPMNSYSLNSLSAVDIRAFGVEERYGEVYLVAYACDAFDGFQCYPLRKFRVRDLDSCSSDEWQPAATESIKGVFNLTGLFFRVCWEEQYFQLKYDPAIWMQS